jgi:hypothetical protein
MATKKQVTRTTSEKSTKHRPRKPTRNEPAKDNLVRAEAPGQADSILTGAEQSAAIPTPESSTTIPPLAVEAETTALDQPRSQPSARVRKLSALDAAALVLSETGQAMSCRELIAVMAAKGYWSSPKGKTPASTLYAAVQRELQSKGEQAYFRKAEPGKFMLRTSP